MTQTVAVIDPEQVAYWFFRLQGCLTITNFMLHCPDEKGLAYSDGDVIAVRFPHRREHLMQLEEERFLFSSDKIDLCLVDVTYRDAGATLNDTFTGFYGERNLHYALERIGMFAYGNEQDTIAETLYRDGIYEDARHRVRVLTIAQEIVETVPPQMPYTVFKQLTWKGHVMPLLHRRFTRYDEYQRYCPQWDAVGQQLRDWALQDFYSNRDFITLVTAAMNEHTRQKSML